MNIVNCLCRALSELKTTYHTIMLFIIIIISINIKTSIFHLKMVCTIILIPIAYIDIYLIYESIFKVCGLKTGCESMNTA